MSDGTGTPDGPPPPPEPPAAAGPSFVAPGTAPGMVPGVVPPPSAVPPPPPPAPPSSPTSASASAVDATDRPAPNIVSLGAAAGGAIAAIGLFALLSDSDVAKSRGSVLFASALFAAIGIGLMFWNRSRRAVAGGVALTALAVVPLVSALFRSPTDTSILTDPSGYRNTQLATLALLAIIWGACYAVGPGRRNGLFLGAALLALWLIPMTFFSTNATIDALDSLKSPNTGLIFGNSSDPFGSSGSGSSFDSSGSDPFGSLGGSSTDPFGTSSSNSLPLKLGVTSLLFGGVYLALAGRNDTWGDRRMATPFFAVAPIILFQALTNLSGDLKVVGTSCLGIALGGVAVWLGARSGRRFTSWIGVASIVASIVNMVDDGLKGKPMATGIVLALFGLFIVGAMSFFESTADFGGSLGRPADTGPTDAAPPASPPPAPLPQAWAPPAESPQATWGPPTTPPQAPPPSAMPPSTGPTWPPRPPGGPGAPS